MPFKLIWETRDPSGKRKYSQAWTRGAKAYIRGHHAGHPYFESLQTRSRSVAAQQFAKRQSEIVEGANAGIDGKINFAGAVKLYFGSEDPEVIDPTGRIAKIFDKIAERKIATFGQSDLDDLAKELRPNAGPKTRNREVYTPFIAVYNAAAADGKAVERRWRRPKGAHDDFETSPPSDEQIALLIKAASRIWGRSELEAIRNKAAILMVTLTGERNTAISTLKAKDISFWGEDEGAVVFGKTKNRKPRRVLMPPILVRAMREYLDLLAKESPTGTVGHDRQIFRWETRAGLSRMILRARKTAGIGDFRPHDVGRHGFGRRIRQTAGIDLPKLKKAGNWLSDAAVARYDHFAADEVDHAVRDVDTKDLETGPLVEPPHRRRNAKTVTGPVTGIVTAEGESVPGRSAHVRARFRGRFSRTSGGKS
jgi:integrase